MLNWYPAAIDAGAFTSAGMAVWPLATPAPPDYDAIALQREPMPLPAAIITTLLSTIGTFTWPSSFPAPSGKVADNDAKRCIAADNRVETIADQKRINAHMFRGYAREPEDAIGRAIQRWRLSAMVENGGTSCPAVKTLRSRDRQSGCGWLQMATGWLVSDSSSKRRPVIA